MTGKFLRGFVDGSLSTLGIVIGASSATSAIIIVAALGRGTGQWYLQLAECLYNRRSGTIQEAARHRTGRGGSNGRICGDILGEAFWEEYCIIGSQDGAVVHCRGQSSLPGSVVHRTFTKLVSLTCVYFFFHSPVSRSFRYSFFTAAQATLWAISSRLALSRRLSGSLYCSKALLKAARYISWACLGRLL